MNNIFHVSIEKNTPKELEADSGFISRCQDYLENWEAEKEQLQLK